MLQELSKKDNQWREIAYRICKDRCLADDLVQDMYLKLCNNEKAINDFYIIIVIRNAFLDYIKQSHKTISLEGFDLADSKHNFEYDDKEHNFVKGLKWWEKEILELSHDKSYREIEKEYNIHYKFTHRIVTKTKNKWQDQKNNIKD